MQVALEWVWDKSGWQSLWAIPCKKQGLRIDANEYTNAKKRVDLKGLHAVKVLTRIYLLDKNSIIGSACSEGFETWILKGQALSMCQRATK